MSDKIALTGEAWRENGAWRLDLRGPKWVVDEVVAELNSRTLKVADPKDSAGGFVVAECTTEKKADANDVG